MGSCTWVQRRGLLTFCSGALSRARLWSGWITVGSSQSELSCKDPSATPVPPVLLWNRGGSAARTRFPVWRAPVSLTALHRARPAHTCGVP